MTWQVTYGIIIMMIMMMTCQVTYGIRVSEEGLLETEPELSLRNITVNIGCSCSYFVPVMFQDVSLVEERRRRRRK